MAERTPKAHATSPLGAWAARWLGHRFALSARLAWEDYRHEWIVSGCSVLALAAVLIPLLVLFGLKYGIITNLLDPLTENPRYREIAPLTSGRFAPDWFERMAARDEIEFVVPRTRALAASIKLRAPNADVGRIIDAELIPSGPDDPVLSTSTEEPVGFRDVVLSAGAAEKLRVDRGAHVEGVLSRTRHDNLETVRLPMTVVGVAPRAGFTRDGVFVSQDLIVAVEDFLDGRAVPALGWDGDAPRNSARDFAGFRMYARNLDDVAPLRAALLEQNVDRDRGYRLGANARSQSRHRLLDHRRDRDRRLLRVVRDQRVGERRSQATGVQRAPPDGFPHRGHHLVPGAASDIHRGVRMAARERRVLRRPRTVEQPARGYDRGRGTGRKAQGCAPRHRARCLRAGGRTRGAARRQACRTP
jgi:hypothetical protein